MKEIKRSLKHLLFDADNIKNDIDERLRFLKEHPTAPTVYNDKPDQEEIDTLTHFRGCLLELEDIDRWGYYQINR